MRTFISTLTQTKKIISKAAAVFSAAAIISSAAIIPVSADAASGSFITQLPDGSGISIDASQIKSILTQPKSEAYPISFSYNTSSINANGKFSTTPGQMMILNVTVNGINETTAKLLKLYATSSNTNKNKPDFATLEIPSKSVRSNGNNSYTLTYKFESYGDTLTLSISNNGIDLSGIQSVTAELKDDPDFYSVQALSPEGYESFIAAAPKRKTVSKSDILSWAKNCCLFVNSLSDMTGIKKDTVFVEFYGGGSCDLDTLDAGYFDKYALVSIHGEATETDIMLWEEWDKDIPKICHEELHEYSHAYALDFEKVSSSSAKLSGYDSEATYRNGAYYKRNNFSNFYNMNLDDIFTNVRGITAIQHCKQLRDTMYITQTSSYNYNTGGYDAPKYEGRYFNYLQRDLDYINAEKPGWDRVSINSVENDRRAHWFNAKIANIAIERNAWNRLKTFFRGEEPANISDEVYSWFGKYIFGSNTSEYNGIKWDLSYKLSYPGNINCSQEKLKLVNTTYKLWQLFDYQSNFNQWAYESFLNNYFDQYLLKSILV